SGDVAVPILERIIGLAPRPKKIFERWREQIPDLRRPVSPIVRESRLMNEVDEIKFERAVCGQANYLSHSISVNGPPVRIKPHDLVFVAIMRKAEILGQRVIKDA